MIVFNPLWNLGNTSTRIFSIGVYLILVSGRRHWCSWVKRSWVFDMVKYLIMMEIARQWMTFRRQGNTSIQVLDMAEYLILTKSAMPLRDSITSVYVPGVVEYLGPSKGHALVC